MDKLILALVTAAALVAAIVLYLKTVRLSDALFELSDALKSREEILTKREEPRAHPTEGVLGGAARMRGPIAVVTPRGVAVLGGEEAAGAARGAGKNDPEPVQRLPPF